MENMKCRLLGMMVALVAIFGCVFAQEKNPGKEPFKSNLPIILIESENPLNAQEKQPARMKVIYSKGKKQYASNETKFSYNGPINIKLRGNSSLGYRQKKFTFETRDDNGKEADVELLGMPAEHDWVLLAPYADVSMLRDAFAFELWTQMGYWAPRTRMCEVVYNGEYAGIYTLAEKVKPGANRLNIAKLKKSDTSGRELTGGYLLRIDTYNEKDATFQSKVAGIGQGLMMPQITWTCLFPKKKNLQQEQFDYIQNFIDEMEKCIDSDDYADEKNGYSKYLNISSFVDYFIHTELSLNADAYKRSAYFYKTKQNEDGTGGKLHAGPTWDYNLAYGCCNFCNADDINAWAFEGCNTNPTPQIWKKLFMDKRFLDKVKARYAELRKTIYSEKNLFAIIDGFANQLKPCQQRHFDKFPELLDKETKRHEPSDGMGGFGGFGGFGDFQMPEGGFQMPEGMDFGGFGGFGGFGNFQMPEGGFQMPEGMNFGGFGGFGGGFTGMDDDMGGMGMMVSMFRSYEVKNYDDEIKLLKEWLSERLKVLDEKLEYTK